MTIRDDGANILYAMAAAGVVLIASEAVVISEHCRGRLNIAAVFGSLPHRGGRHKTLRWMTTRIDVFSRCLAVWQAQPMPVVHCLEIAFRCAERAFSPAA